MAVCEHDTNKRYVLGDSSVNVYGFRLLTSGYQSENYTCNPIGYYMHDRDAGVVVKWKDLKVEGDKITAIPVINTANERGQQTVNEIESGFLNAASFGHLVIVEYSYDTDLMMPGQTGPTATKWFNRECSLVDIPGNYGSLQLYDVEGNEINLSDFSNPDFNFLNTKDMKQIILTAVMMRVLNLDANSDANAAELALADLSAKAAKLPELEKDLLATKKELADLKEASELAANGVMLKAAVDAGKISQGTADQLAADYKGKTTDLKKLLDAMPTYQSLSSKLKDTTTDDKGKYQGKTWDELDKAGLLEDLKAKDFDAFKNLFQQRFNKEYTG